MAFRWRSGACRRQTSSLTAVACAVCFVAAFATSCQKEDSATAPPDRTEGESSSQLRVDEPPSTSGSPGEDGPRYRRIQPGMKVDIRASKNYGPSRWTGPIDLDLARLTLINGRSWVVARLVFSRLGLQRLTERDGDDISVYLDDEGSRGYEREINIPWGSPGRLYSGALSESDNVGVCRFDPVLEPAIRTLVLRVPRDCFPYLTRMRASARFISLRRSQSVTWSAVDSTAWTDVADVGDVVTVTDPAAPRKPK